jgi:hypothetical protein
MGGDEVEFEAVVTIDQKLMHRCPILEADSPGG